jgi:hypothetical protein
MPTANNVQFTVEPVDVDGNGVKNGDLITKYVNGRVDSRKVVPVAKIINATMKNSSSGPANNSWYQAQLQQQQYGTRRNNSINGGRVLYRNMPPVQERPYAPVMVQERSNLGQSMKQSAASGLGFGLGAGIGSSIGSSLWGGFTSLWSSNE